MDRNPFISICILSYNRPETLERLLKSIDLDDTTKLELVVCEDCSPKQKDIRAVVSAFSSSNQMHVVYSENSENLGYDRTFNNLCRLASGDWLIFMGDDDEFVPGGLASMISFLNSNENLGYVMKSHLLIHDDGSSEQFRYFQGNQFFEPGVDSYVKLFRRSVFIAGFTIKRRLIIPHITDEFDGSMLMQLYLLAEVVLEHCSAYLDIPFTQQYASHKHNEGDVMYDRQKKSFIERKPSVEISVNFLASFAKITNYLDSKYGFNSTQKIRHDMSKYLYPSLAIHRSSGLRVFFSYVLKLRKLGFSSSLYFYLYVILLVLLNKRLCDFGIRRIKNSLGYTPQL